MKPALYTLCGVAVLLCALDLVPLFVPAYDIGQTVPQLRNFVIGMILAAVAVSGGFRS